MRLSTLDPQWLRIDRRDVGLDFLCPCGKHRIQLRFLNPMDVQGPHTKGPFEPGWNLGNLWSRSGLSFADMSLAPSLKNDCGEWWLLDGDLQQS